MGVVVIIWLFVDFVVVLELMLDVLCKYGYEFCCLVGFGDDEVELVNCLFYVLVWE